MRCNHEDFKGGKRGLPGVGALHHFLAHRRSLPRRGVEEIGQEVFRHPDIRRLVEAVAPKHGHRPCHGHLAKHHHLARLLMIRFRILGRCWDSVRLRAVWLGDAMSIWILSSREAE